MKQVLMIIITSVSLGLSCAGDNTSNTLDTTAPATATNAPALHDADTVWETIDTANRTYNHATENFVAEARNYTSITGIKLTSGRKIKEALALCAFNSTDFFNAEDSYRAAHVVWKSIRDEVRAGTIAVHRVDWFGSPDFQTTKEYSSSCGVWGPDCSVDLHFQGSPSLFVRGDSCQ